AFAVRVEIALPCVIEKEFAIGLFHHPVYGVEIVGEEAFRRSALGCHSITGKAVVAAGGEVDGLAIPAPAIYLIGSVVVGKLADVATGQRHHVDVVIAELVGREGWPLAIGRSPWGDVVAAHRREA